MTKIGPNEKTSTGHDEGMDSGPGRRRAWDAVGVLAGLLLLAGALAPSLGAQEPLGSGSLAISGSTLIVSPAAQTVPFDTPTVIETALSGFDGSVGSLPPGLRVRADLLGPEIDGVLPLETIPGQPLRIPRLRLEGEYQVENIRLVDGDTVVQFAEPRDATVLVTQILVTRVSSRALTLDEIRSYGLVINEDSFQGLNLTFGFAVAGRTIEYSMPLTYDLYGPGDNGLNLENVRLPQFGGGTVPTRGRFQPPQLTPFEIRLEGVRKEIPKGGCDQQHSECREREPPAPPLVGVVLFPTDVSLLNQFFAVVLMVQNGAPEGDPLVVRDLFARIQLPPGLRSARTEPATPLGVPVPVRVPGPDGELGTADDLHFLIAQAEGAAEFFVEGQREGTYLVDFTMQGVLEGLPTGPQPIFGSAKGAVVVRDPSLSVTISHPATVRNDEQYPLYLTVSNTGPDPVNQLSLRLPTSGLSGTVVVGANEQTIPTLLPGDSEVVEFQLESRRTGRVVASSVRADAGLSPRFDLQIGVGNGIPLSPESLALPSSVEDLSPELIRASMALVGLGHSLATAPPDLVGSDLPRLGRAVVDERIYRLAQAGRHVHLGEEPFDSVAILTEEWLGARDRDPDWDALRRQVDKGIRFADAVAGVLSEAEPQPKNLFDRLAETTDFLEPGLVLVEGSGVTVEVEERASGRRVALDAVGERTRDLPFAELLELSSAARLAVLAAPDAGGHRLRLRMPAGGAASLRLLTRDANGAPRALQWTGVALSPSSIATLEFGTDGDPLRLLVDDDGDGDSERDLGAGGSNILSPRPFAAVAAVQNGVVDPSGHVVDVLFTQDIEITSLLPRDPGHFVVPGKVSNGGLVPTEADIVEGLLAGGTVHENPFEGLFNTRVVRVVFDNPLSPYGVNPLTLNDIDGASGERIDHQVLPQVVTTTEHEGIQVEGTVFGPDGQPVPFAEVQLWERDLSGTEPNILCTRHVTAATLADAQGRYHFDFVRKGDCGDLFEVEGIDRQRPNEGIARGRVRFIGQTQTLDVRMVGRGRVEGQILFADGGIPDGLQVVIYHPVSGEGRRAHVGQDGRFDADEIPVGTLNLAANDSEGNFLYATFEMPRAGAIVEKNLVMVRQTEAPRGGLRGTIFDLSGSEPQFNAYVALYVEGERIGVRRSALDGSFDFGIVPAGSAVVEAFDGMTGRQGDQLNVTIEPDQVADVTLLLRNDTGTVEGNVFRRQVDGTVVPVAGAVVYIQGLPHNTTTDAQGFYRLDNIFAGNWQVVAADLVTQERQGAPVTLTSSGGTQTRDLYFQEKLPSGGITGQVLDYDGNPVQGATVHLSGDYYSVDWHHEASTSAEGRFVLTDLDPGIYGVHAYRGADGGVGFAHVRFPGDTPSVTVQFRKANITVRTFIVSPETGEEIGVLSTIVYRHTKVINAWGVVALDSGFQSTLTEDDGSFTIPDALVGPYEIYVYNALQGNRRIKGTIEDQGDDRHHDVEFQLNGSIDCMVYDWDGVTPVPGATVRLTGGSFQDFDLTSDAEGRVHFDLVPKGNYTLSISTDNGLIFRRQRVGVRVALKGEEVEVEAVLPKQGEVQGLVQTAPDANGVSAPVPGAVVTLREGGYPWRTLIHNADENGYFAFENIFEGEVTLEAQAPSLGGLGGRVVEEIHTEAQEVTTFIELEPVAEISVRVVSPETGLPVPGVRIDLARSHFFDAVSSDEEGEGRFRLLPLGNYRVHVFDPDTGRRGRSAWIDLAENNQLEEVEVVLEIRGDVAGVLTDGNTAKELPGRVIKLRSYGLRWFTTYATTGRDGDFVFEGIPEGDFTLETHGPQKRRWARAEGYLAEEDEVITLDLVLEQTGTVIGRVLNPPGLANGPWEQSEVNVWLEQGSWVVDASLENPYALSGVVANRRFVMRAKERGGLHQAVSSDVLATEGGEKTVDLRLRALGSATVSVFDSNDQPVPGASVALHNGHEFAFGGSSFDASTGSDHQVAFDDIREGTLWTRAIDPRTGLKGSVSGRLALEGENVDLRVRLENSGSIVGQVVLSDGMTPAVGTTVALSIGGRYYLLSTGEDGSFDFDTIPMGSFTLYLQELFGPGTLERYGNLSSNNQVVNFGLLVLDDEDPHVVSITPAAGSRDQSENTAPVVTFSEPIWRSQLGNRSCGSWLQLRRADGFWLNSWCDWSADGMQVTITPQQTLGSSTAYYLRITTDVVDLAGRHLPWSRRSTFYTRDYIPPGVIDIVPRHGANQVPVDSPIDILMSEPIDLVSLSGNALELYDLTTGTPWQITPDLRPGDRRIRINPDVAMVPDRQMRVTVRNLADKSGNIMPQPVVTTFWTPDETPPTVSWLSPAAGDVFTAGDTIAVTVDATDNRGMERLRLTLGEWSTELLAPPYTWQIPAPVMAVAGDVAIVAEAFDIFGNGTTSNQIIRVEPLLNTVPPTVSTSCPRPADLVAMGVEIPVTVVASDDLAIESLWLEVDGQQVGRETPVNLAETLSSLPWTPPADATPGQVFELSFSVRDFAGNVTVHPLTVQIPTSTVLVGDHLLDTGSVAAPLALGQGTFLSDSPLAFAEVTLLHGAVLELAGSEAERPWFPALSLQCGSKVRAGTAGDLRLVVDGLLRIDTGAVIEADAKGFEGGDPGTGARPPGVAGSAFQAGGSHGGAGATGAQQRVPGEVFGSVYWPHQPGGGGGSGVGTYYALGGAGGGVVDLDVGQLLLDGEIRARGQDGLPGYEEGSAAGAGGTVRLVADSVSGEGRVDVSGGSGCWGAGGGGRVALRSALLDDFDPATHLRAWGGSYNCTLFGEHAPEPLGYGAPGTIMVHTAESIYGSLLIDSGTTTSGDDRIGGATELTSLGEGLVVSLDASGPGVLLTGPEPFGPQFRGAWVELLDVAGNVLGVYRVSALEGGAAVLEGAVGVAGAATYRGVYRFDSVDLRHGADLELSDPIEAVRLDFDGEVELSGDIIASEVIVHSGAILRPAGRKALRFRVRDRMVVEAGALIDASGTGYPGGDPGTGGSPAGITGSTVQAGGSHGGVGASGAQNRNPGAVYGSVYQPDQEGAGGGSGVGTYYALGGPGGGVVDLEVGTLTLVGEIRARGGDGLSGYEEGSAPGAGGTVRVQATTLEGSGSIDVSGGSSCWGAGGGGRVALWVDQLIGFDPSAQVKAWGGSYNCSTSGDHAPEPLGYGATGTVLWRTSASTFGTLLLDRGTTALGEDRVGPATELPALGSGEVSSLTDLGPDALLTSVGGFLPRWRGAWLELLGASGEVLGTFRVARLEAAGAVLEGAAGVSGGVTYRGLYRFDDIAVLHGADVDLADPLEVANLTFDGEVELSGDIIASEVIVHSGAILRPAARKALRFRVRDRMVVEAGALIDASGTGYPGGDPGTGGSPAGITGSTVQAGGSHGGVGASGAQNRNPGAVYGSVYQPDQEGAGGGSGVGTYYALGGPGGGVVDLEVGTLTLVGEIRARGGDGLSGYEEGSAPGAGGTVRVQATTLEGSGSIDVSGGSSCWGAGGGGRVALWVDQLIGFDPSAQVKAWGGSYNCSTSGDHAPEPLGYGATGTVLWRTSASTFGTLLLDRGTTALGEDRVGPATELPALGSGEVSSLTDLGPDALLTSVGGFLPRWRGAWLELLDASGEVLGTFRVARLEAAGAVLEGAAGVSGGVTYRGLYRFDNIELGHNADLLYADPLQVTDLELTGEVVLSDDVVARSVVVRSGAVVRSAQSTLRFQVSDVMVIEAGARLEVDARGYAGGDPGTGAAPSAVQGSARRAGGSHGGEGATAAQGRNPGDVFDSVAWPSLPGGGGGSGDGTYYARGGAGGGVIDLEVGSLVLDGEIRARGQNGLSGYANGSAAGAGGTVLIVAGSLDGLGVIDVGGGQSCWGAGGGGRIAIWLAGPTTFDPASQARARGGSYSCTIYGTATGVPQGWAAPGTVFLSTEQSTFGDLFVAADPDAASFGFDATELPLLGSGVVGVATVDASVATDLWIEPADPAQRFALGVIGMWLRVDGVDYRVLDQTADRRSILLGDAAGFVAPGDGFQGIYKFDQLIELNNAIVTSSDPIELGGTISDSQISVADASAVESAGSLVFTLDLMPPPAGDVAVAYQLIEGSALEGLDFEGASGNLVIPAGSGQFDLVVTLLDDFLDEPAETFDLVLGSAVGATVVDGQATGTVIDDDATPGIQVSDVVVIEGDGEAVDATFVVTLSHASGQTVSVGYQTVDGTALAGLDYVASQGTVIFLPGETSQEVVVMVTGDLIDEPAETFELLLSLPSGATLTDGQGLATVSDNDPPVPELTVGNASAVESAGQVVFEIQLSETAESDLVLGFATRDIEALAGSDYWAAVGQLVIPAGTLGVTLPVALIDDTVIEPSETFALDLVAPSGTVLVDGEGIATIDDDDAPTEFVESAAALGLDLGQAKQGGFAFCDIDLDGDLDLLVNIDWNDSAGRSRLLVLEDGVYVDHTATHAAGLARKNLHRSALCGDLTGDGWPDLVRNGLEEIEIYANGGPDADPPFSFGQGGASGAQGPSQVIDTLASGGPFTEGLGLLDVDLDGDLDLVVENDAAGLALLLNDGSGTLVETDPASWGLPTSAIHGDYLAVADYDGDGWVDVLARRLGGPDLYRNTGSGFVVEPSLSDETDLVNRGGVSFCDFDADGDLDVFWTDAGTNQIWRNDDGLFVATGEPEASAGVSVTADIDDAACADIDLDGDIDLFLASASGPGHLFLNQTPAGGTLSFVADNRGIDLAGANAEAATFADIDHDGDPDLYVQVDFGANQLWLNPTNDAGSANYLAVRATHCLPGGALRDALGARVRLVDPVSSTPLSPVLEVSGGRGHGTQDPATVLFGLPQGAGRTYRVEVFFPGVTGQPGPLVSEDVVPADLLGYRGVTINDCAATDLPPVAEPRVLGYQSGIDLPITLRGHDPEGHALIFEVVDPPQAGTLSGTAPNLIYTPPVAGLRETFTFRVWDGIQPSAVATVRLEPPLVPFVEAASAMGLDLGEAKQGGFVFCDVDRDGDLDLMVNIDWNDPAGRSRLLFDEGGAWGDRTATHAAGLSRYNLHRSALCGDLTGDGWPDLVRNGLDRIEIYYGGGPTTSPAFSFGAPGVDGAQSPNQVIETLAGGGPFTEGLGLLDADLDGDLDLLVENDEAGMALLLNDGTGTLVEADATAWGLPSSAVHGDYLAVADYDADGRVDFLARKQGAPDLYHNVGGHFVVEGSLDDETDLWNRGGVGFCDLDADGDFDAIWTDAGTNQIWRNDGGTFVATGEPATSAGVVIDDDVDDVACGDIDLDGDLDLFLSTAAGPGYLFVNETLAGGALDFRLDNGGLSLGANGEAATFADVDLDGDLDLYVQVDFGANQLWLGGAAGTTTDYLAVEALRCTGTAYRHDLGALIRLYAADGVEPLSPVLELNGGRGHGTQDPARAHFGLPWGSDVPIVVEVRFLGAGGLPGPVVRQTVVPENVSATAPAGYRLLSIRDQEVCP